MGQFISAITERIVERLLLVVLSAAIVSIPTWWNTAENARIEKNTAIAHAIREVSKAIKDCK